jgi:hypothetical protein
MCLADLACRERLVAVVDTVPIVSYKDGGRRAFSVTTVTTQLVIVADDLKMKKAWVRGIRLAMVSEQQHKIARAVAEMAAAQEQADALNAEAEAARDHALAQVRPSQTCRTRLADSC